MIDAPVEGETDEAEFVLYFEQLIAAANTQTKN
jgi:hypothetical protein